MSTLVASATGNFTAAGTWKVADTTSLLHTDQASTAASTTYQGSSNFMPGPITTDGLGLFVLSRSATPSGLLYVELYNATLAASVVVTTINVADIPNTGEGNWLILPIAPTLLLAGNNYQTRIKTTNAAMVTAYRDATANNWARLLRTTTTAAPAAGDVFIVSGEKTGPGAMTSYSVTMDNTTGTVFGSPVATRASLSVCDGGSLVYPTTAGLALRLVLAGFVNCHGGSTLTRGTAGDPIPTTSSATLEFVIATNNDSYLHIHKGATYSSEGASTYASTRARLTADVAATGTVLTTDISTGWPAGDLVAISPTKRVLNEGESRTLSINAAGTTVTLSSGLTYAHDGVALQAHVINMTRNVKTFGTSQTLCAYIRIFDGAIANCKKEEIIYMGSATTGQRGVVVDNASVDTVFEDCSFHDFFSTANTAMGVHSNLAGLMLTLLNNNFYNVGYIAIYMQQVSATDLNVNGNIAIGGPIAGAAGYGMLINSSDANASDNVMTGYGQSTAFVGASPIKLGTVANNSGNSCSSGLTVTGVYDSTITAPNFRRTNGQGMNLSSNLNLNIINPVSTGNVNSSLSMTSNQNCIISGITATGEAGFTQPYSVYIAGINPGCVVSGTFGGAGALGATTADVVTTGISSSLHFHEPDFLSPVEFVVSVWKKGNSYSAEKIGGIAGSNKVVKWEGTLVLDTTIFDGASPSLRMTPTQASVKLESMQAGQLAYTAAVASGNTVPVSVRVRKSVVGDGTAYNGNQPRLMVRANLAAGYTTNTVLATASGAAGSWETLSATTGVISADTVLEFFVDCDGTTGWVNIDTIETENTSTSGTGIYKFGAPFVTGSAGLSNFTDVDTSKVELGFAFNYNSATPNRTGTRRQPATSEVKISTLFGPSDTLTGTYDGSDRWSDPGESNVRNLIAYKANSLTNNKTGNVIEAAVASVLSGTIYGSSGSLTGTFTAATAAQVWQYLTEGAESAEQTMRIMRAALAGKRAGLGGPTESYYSKDGTKVRISFPPIDNYGNGTPTTDGTP